MAAHERDAPSGVFAVSQGTVRCSGNLLMACGQGVYMNLWIWTKLYGKKTNPNDCNVLLYSRLDIGWALLGITMGFVAVALAREILQPQDALCFVVVSAPAVIAQHVWLGLSLSTGPIRIRACRWISAAANSMLFGIVAASALFAASAR